MEQEQKKILLICNTSTTVMTFRVTLIRALKDKGLSVSVIAFDDKRKSEIEAEGVRFYCLSDNNRSTNPFKVLSLKNRYKHLIKKFKPDIVMTFQLKPNIFGVLGAKKAGVSDIYSMVEGAGDAFVNNDLKWKIIRFVMCRLYKKSFKFVKKVFFLNNDDKSEFVRRKLVKESQCEIVHGIGVDLERFAYKPIKNYKSFLMIARLVKAKGVFEYCKCARIVKKKYPEAEFNYLGAEHSLKVSDIQEYIDDGSINYLGETADVRPYLENATLLVLPSYREGMPMSVMEAESVGRAVIVSDCIGCRDTVVNGYNGFLVPVGDYEQMVEKVIWCIEHPAEMEQMGKNALVFAEEHFNQKRINERIVEVIEQVI